MNPNGNIELGYFFELNTSLTFLEYDRLSSNVHRITFFLATELEHKIA